MITPERVAARLVNLLDNDYHPPLEVWIEAEVDPENPTVVLAQESDPRPGEPPMGWRITVEPVPTSGQPSDTASDINHR